MDETTADVVVIGGGMAGLTASIFTARHDLETLVFDTGESILRRNAHLENFPGFPAGVNARHLLDLVGEQADDAGVTREPVAVTSVSVVDGTFAVETADDDVVLASYVIAATKNEVGYLEDVEGVGIIDRGDAFVDVDERGRSGVDGLYVAGRLAEIPHQAVVSAGHGAMVAVTLLEDDDRPFYHDWVTPSGYFTDRGRDLPPGCEEIDPDESRRREERSLEIMRERFDELHPDEQETHPSLVE